MTDKPFPKVNSYSVHEDQLKWFDVPLVAGGKAAVLHGDPTKPGTVVMRFKFPPNRQTPPHRHPYAEYTTILSGTVYYGEGEKFDTSNPEVGKVGTFAIVPAGQAHFVWTLEEEAIVQLQFEGPSNTIYVDLRIIRNADNSILMSVHGTKAKCRPHRATSAFRGNSGDIFSHCVIAEGRSWRRGRI